MCLVFYFLTKKLQHKIKRFFQLVFYKKIFFTKKLIISYLYFPRKKIAIFFNFFYKNVWIIKKVIASLHHIQQKGCLLVKI